MQAKVGLDFMRVGININSSDYFITEAPQGIASFGKFWAIYQQECCIQYVAYTTSRSLSKHNKDAAKVNFSDLGFTIVVTGNHYLGGLIGKAVVQQFWIQKKTEGWAAALGPR
jgi:hypothetical protein